jgi:hypothetical protein
MRACLKNKLKQKKSNTVQMEVKRVSFPGTSGDYISLCFAPSVRPSEGMRGGVCGVERTWALTWVTKPRGFSSQCIVRMLEKNQNPAALKWVGEPSFQRRYSVRGN